MVAKRKEKVYNRNTRHMLLERKKCMEPTRLNKYLSEIGYCSRREADRLIAAGKVTVNGEIPEMGSKVIETDVIVVDGQPVEKEERKVLLVLNKPRGVVCTTARFPSEQNVVDYVNYPIRVYPVGRLDKDSQGLLLLTNQGDLVNRLMRSANAHEKEYVVTVDKPLTDEFLKHLAAGVYLEELQVTTRPCQVEKMDVATFRIILTQGLNRQIRRMCENFGYRVRRLKRVRIMNIELKDLPVGKWREATKEEQCSLWQLVQEPARRK